MKITVYAYRTCFFCNNCVLIFLIFFVFLIHAAYATEQLTVSNPNFIINAPRTSPYADHPDLWQGRTVLQVPDQEDTPTNVLTLDSVQPYIEQPSHMAQPELWYPYGAPQTSHEVLWEEGSSFEEMNRVDLHRLAVTESNKEMASVNDMLENTRGGYALNSEVFIEPLNTRHSIAAQLKNLAEYHANNLEYEENLEETQGAAGMAGRSTDQDVTWRSPVTEPVKIDEDVLSSKRNVVGAYVNMQNDNMHFFVGPELHIPDSSPLEPQDRDMEDSELGLGMQMLWGF